LKSISLESVVGVSMVGSVMTVYTQMHEQDMRDISGRYNLTLVNYESIADGDANTNYLVHTPLGRCVLTVFEEQTFDQVVKLGQFLIL
jgi:hypothetical protein